MNEVKKCSISGLSFRMEEDAWRMLNDYLASLKKTYADSPDGNEIIADIEARIAELILSVQDNETVVGRPLIANIIAQLGTAEDIREESSVDDDRHTTPEGEPRIPRRLYRDMENARLGGVCSGIARYFDIDPIKVRLAALSPLFLIAFSVMPWLRWLEDFGFTLFCVAFICYIVMWFAVPAARTPRQKLEADGERITVRSIHETSAANRDIDSKARPVVAETVTVFGRILIVLMKLFGALIFFGLMLVALGLLVALCIVLCAAPELFGTLGVAGDMLAAMDEGAIYVILGILVVLLPVSLLLYVLASLLFGPKPNRAVMLVLFLLWVATIVALPVVAIKHDARIGVGYSYSDDSRSDEHERMLDSLDRLSEEPGLESTIMSPDADPATEE